MQALKSTDGPDVVILGSGSIVSQLTEARLIDEYQLVLTAVALGKGRTPFQTLADADVHLEEDQVLHERQRRALVRAG
jgi:dihydrofolate reductase